MDDYRIATPHSLRQLYYRRRAVTLSESDDMARLMGQGLSGNATEQSKRPLGGTKSYAGNTETAFSRGHRSVMLSGSDCIPSRSAAKNRNCTSSNNWNPYPSTDEKELVSPRLSPVPWLLRRCFSNQDGGGGGGGGGGSATGEGRHNSTDDTQRLIDPSSSKSSYGASSNSVTSPSERGSDDEDDFDSDAEGSEQRQQHRERRKAIFDSKSLCLASPLEDHTLSPHESYDEAEASGTSLHNRPRRRKKSSADLGIHYPGDLLLSQARPKRIGRPLNARNTIADFANTKTYQASTASLISACEQDRKVKTSFSLLKLIDKKSHRGPKETLPELTEVLQNLKRSEFSDNYLYKFKGAHWFDLMEKPETEDEVMINISDIERKRREAVWELFTSEYVFLVDHLMALKHCFMEPLKQVQVEGYLMFAEPQDLFGNLDEVCSVSYNFCCEFISLLLKDTDFSTFGSNDVLIQGLTRFCQLTRDGEVYHDYCLNYSKAMTYLEQLRKNEDFIEFEKWCEQDPRCNRLLLTDLLIAPMQHCTKVPLLLNNICRYTENPDEQKRLMESLEQLETSLKNLEAKMNWLKNFERVQEIQQQIVWMSITELEPRAFIPEFLKPLLLRQPCERILASPKRLLLHEGPVVLIEVSKTVEMYLFLFDDILLLTKVKKPPRKMKPPGCDTLSYMPLKSQTDGAIFTVYRQPIALDRFTVHDIRQSDSTVAANGLRNAFVIIQITRFQQVIGVYTLQAPSDSAKAAWMIRIPEAQEKYRKLYKSASESIVSGNQVAPVGIPNTSGDIDQSGVMMIGGKLLLNNDCSAPGSPRSPRLSPSYRSRTSLDRSSSRLSSDSPRQQLGSQSEQQSDPVFDYPTIVSTGAAVRLEHPSLDNDRFLPDSPSSWGADVVASTTGSPRSSQFLSPPQIHCHSGQDSVQDYCGKGSEVLDRFRAKSLRIRHRPNLRTIREKSQSIDALHKK